MLKSVALWLKSQARFLSGGMQVSGPWVLQVAGTSLEACCFQVLGCTLYLWVDSEGGEPAQQAVIQACRSLGPVLSARASAAQATAEATRATRARASAADTVKEEQPEEPPTQRPRLGSPGRRQVRPPDTAPPVCLLTQRVDAMKAAAPSLRPRRPQQAPWP